MAAIERVVLVHRLREVVAQVGFTRFEAAGPDIQGELDMAVQRAPIGLDVSWLPAVENRGEGVFLQFRAEAIDAWLARASVQQRDADLQSGFAMWLADHGGGVQDHLAALLGRPDDDAIHVGGDHVARGVVDATPVLRNWGTPLLPWFACPAINAPVVAI